MSHTVIREARPEEHEEAGRITAGAYAEFFADGAVDEDRAYLRHVADVGGRAERTTILVAVDRDRIVGCVTLELDGRTEADDEPLAPERAHIRMLGVAPDARERGIGRALMRECESRAAAAGKTVMTLHTTHLMETAQAMYRSMGYERTQDQVLPDGFVLLGYRKALQPSTS
jgi:ribosomal protein S18 acetylase RimI-like enzyme